MDLSIGLVTGWLRLNFHPLKKPDLFEVLYPVTDENGFGWAFCTNLAQRKPVAKFVIAYFLELAM